MSFYDNIVDFQGSIAAITDSGEHVTYSDIGSFADKIYSKINHRCLVFSFCENSLGSLCGYISFLKNRIVPFLLDKDLNTQLLFRLINTYQPEYLWMPDNREPDFEAIPILSRYGYTLYKTNFSKTYELYSGLALLLTTSGSTGSPKLVRISYTNLDSNTESIIKYLSLSEAERPITTLPMSYTYGLSIINSHLAVGATILLTSKTLMQKEFWKFFKEEGATSIGGVPYTYEMLKKLRIFKMDLPSLKTITQAGGKLSIELSREYAQFCQDTGRRFFVMYGQTEATARMSYLPPERAVSKCGSIGIAIPGGCFSLVDANANTIYSSEVTGELIYEGPNVTLGYAECGDDLKKGDERFGILYTGDMAKRDSEGFYYITGRKKRFIKMFGNRVNLDEVEQLLKSIVQDCACTGHDDYMKIYIIEEEKREEVISFISEKTGLNKLGFEVVLVERIPKNESGKTLYVDL